MHAISYCGRLVRKALAQQATQHRMLAGLLALGPDQRVQVVEHEELAEREKPEVDLVARNFPASLLADDFLHCTEERCQRRQLVGIGIDRVARQVEPKVSLQAR